MNLKIDTKTFLDFINFINRDIIPLIIYIYKHFL